MYHGSLAAITAGTNLAFVEDQSPTHPTWAAWGAEQRDAFVIDRWGRLWYKQNLSAGFDSTGLRAAILDALDATEFDVPAERTSGARSRLQLNGAISVPLSLLVATLTPVAGLVR